MSFEQTAITSLDSYKTSHADQYPAGTEEVYSNFTPRSMKNFKVPMGFSENKIVWFGLQTFLEELNKVWNTTFFERSWWDVKDEAQGFFEPFCGPNGFSLDRLKSLHELGYLPIEIKALPEGSLVPVGIPVLTIKNTLPEFFWITNYLETWMSAELWKSPTSATTSRIYRKIIEKWADETGGSKEFIAWQGHDFSVRGMSGITDAAKSGAGHLLSFTGTDNLPAVKLINDVYFGKETFVGGSVPATEHSVMCASGKESEIETFRRLLKTYPSGVVSIVSDTWDYFKVISEYAVELKDEILNRVPDQFGLAKTVFRPDSGDPVKIICGYQVAEVESLDDVNPWQLECDGIEVLKVDGKYFKFDFNYWPDGSVDGINIEKEISEAEAKGSVQVLFDIFGGTPNDKGYWTLNQRVGLIYGDSITLDRANQILKELADKGFASDNIVFGIGSYTFQYQTRDTLGFAMKATNVVINGESQAIFKDPKTDSGTKKSSRGYLNVVGCSGEFELIEDLEKEEPGAMNLVYLNGSIVWQEKLANIRARLASV